MQDSGDRIFDELFSISSSSIISLKNINLNEKYDRKFISDAAVALYGEGVLMASSVKGKKPKGGTCKPPLDPKGIHIIHSKKANCQNSVKAAFLKIEIISGLMEERLDQCRKSTRQPIDEERSSLKKIEKTLRVKIANLNKRATNYYESVRQANSSKSADDTDSTDEDTISMD